jgi:hypothetical protein
VTLHFNLVVYSVANNGDGFNIEFLMNHEVVALLEKTVNKREEAGEDTSRLHFFCFY